MRPIHVLSALLALSATHGAIAQDVTTTFGAPNLDTAVPADFDGDGRADLAVYRSVTGEWIIRLSRTKSLYRTRFGAPRLDVPVPADYDGDGKSDLAVYRPTTCEWIVLGSKEGLSRTVCGYVGAKPVPGDYDGDGRAQPATYSETIWRVYEPGFGPKNHSPFRTSWDPYALPAPADFDGDGRTDLAVLDTVTGQFVADVTRGEESLAAFKPRSSFPLVGDYDGDGMADAAGVEPTMLAAVRSTLGLVTRAVSTGSVVTPRDFNGDGADDVTEYDRATGLWRIWYSETAPRSQSFAIHAKQVESGLDAPATLTLNKPAPKTIVLDLLLTSSMYQSPQKRQLWIPAGTTEFNFDLPTIPVSGPTTAFIEAKIGARVIQNQIELLEGWGLVAFWVSANRISAGESLTGTVTLARIAPAGGAVVSIQGNLPSSEDCAYPSSVLVPEGQTAATFTVVSKKSSVTRNFYLSAEFHNIWFQTGFTVTGVP